MQTPTIPVIDIAPFRSGAKEDRRRVAKLIGAACEDVGFFTIVGHGIPQDLIDRARASGKAFFDLSRAEKAKSIHPIAKTPRGYRAMGDEALSYSRNAETPPDLKEFYYIGPFDRPRDEYHCGVQGAPYFPDNLWPAQPAEFRTVYTEFYRELEKLAGDVLRMFALTLELPEEYFTPTVDRHISAMRINHYPEQHQAPVPGQLRAGEHTDYGALTILLGENVPGGLQVRTRQGHWIDVKTVANSFVVNIADLMMRWTNDRFVSNLHRVVNPPREVAASSRRLSIALFFHPNYDALIECIPTCASAGNPAKYAPITSGAYRDIKYRLIRVEETLQPR